LFVVNLKSSRRSAKAIGGPTQRVLLRFHKLTTTADSANDKLTITIFARKNCTL